MSMLNRPANSADTGEIVASMREYEAAQKTVSKLIAGEVPARDIAIVGQSVRTIERVTGKLGYAAAARSGAINGVLIGLFLSAILVLGQPEVPIQLFVGFVFIGVALGMLLSLITYAIVRRRRDFASVTQFAADHYEVTVQATSLAKARQVLGAAKTAPVRPPANLDEPPRYGERITPGAERPAPPVQAPGADGPTIPPRPAPPLYGERVDPVAAPPIDEGSPVGGAPAPDPIDGEPGSGRSDAPSDGDADERRPLDGRSPGAAL
ncbi:general stress protein [Microbacterium sp.]|uniref:general stress protein n=1 Tax=Microbacterium sp. TaxID=51671 RepID=UPI002811DB16|nr:general stress protein [Microbacterium sp.]